MLLQDQTLLVLQSGLQTPQAVSAAGLPLLPSSLLKLALSTGPSATNTNTLSEEMKALS